MIKLTNGINQKMLFGGKKVLLLISLILLLSSCGDESEEITVKPVIPTTDTVEILNNDNENIATGTMDQNPSPIEEAKVSPEENKIEKIVTPQETIKEKKIVEQVPVTKTVSVEQEEASITPVNIVDSNVSPDEGTKELIDDMVIDVIDDIDDIEDIFKEIEGEG